MLQSILKLIFGSKYERDIKSLFPIINKINNLEAEIQQLSDIELQSKTNEFRTRLKNNQSLNDILPEAFAVVRETSLRTMKMRHFDVQLMGGISLHQGKIAEMKTGEGKTLTSTLAVYLNAIEGKGVHIVTVNDYLAKRDAEWMTPIYKFLGLTVGYIASNLSHEERQKAYQADITYGTNNEFGFDYLRDNMVEHNSFRVQKKHNFAIVDEVDSILIDEARTPLIISGPAEQNTELYVKVNKIIPELHNHVDYEVDEKSKNVLLTEIGVRKIEKLLNVENLYDPQNVDLVHHVHQSLKAHKLFARDVDYVIQGNEVIIVDEFTGRLMEGRRYSDGLHQALEAKEKVPVKSENQTLATITFQNYFRMYEKLSGMTGTADTEAEEFKKIYNLDVIVLPTNKPQQRIDWPDKIYRTDNEKMEAIAEQVKEAHLKGQPTLLGTVSIENSEKLSSLLRLRGIPHEVLNAKFHEREAEIVASAGQPGKVTIATNMAGRGTDIVLGSGVKEAGGLLIIGSERHESRRIDNQLRGRSGRQGDSGESRFYLSLEDNLMRIFGSDRIAPIMQKLGMKEGESIEHKMISKAIERAQKRVEGHNFEIRKHLLEYDDVMNKQRNYIYSIRDEILNNENIQDLIFEYINDVIDTRGSTFLQGNNISTWDIDGLNQWLNKSFNISKQLSESDLDKARYKDIEMKIRLAFQEKYDEKSNDFGKETLSVLERMVGLQVIDQKWKDHLYEMDQLREGIWTIGYAEKNPLIEYRFKAFALFEEMVTATKEETLEFLFRSQVDGPLGFEAGQYKEQGEAIHTTTKSFSNESELNQKNTSPKKNYKVKSSGGGSKRKSNRRRK